MSHLKTGDTAPTFTLPDHNENTVSLSDFVGKKVLLYFYPKASTPGCTTQTCSVNEALPDFKKHNLVALGISPDDSIKQRKFADKFSVNFPLLCDTGHAVAEAYGVWGEKSMYGKEYMGIIRSAFLIGEDGTLLEVAYKVSPKNTVELAKKA